MENAGAAMSSLPGFTAYMLPTFYPSRQLSHDTGKLRGRSTRNTSMMEELEALDEVLEVGK